MSERLNVWLRGRLLAGILILIVFIFYEVTQYYVGEQAKLASVSGLGRSVMGVSIFYEWSNTLEPDSGNFLRHAFLKPHDLGKSKTIAILSPSAVVTDREARLVDEYVRKGGKLLISFHDDASFQSLYYLLKRFGIEISVAETERFTNGSPIVVTPVDDYLFFRKGEQYAFYSLKLLNTPQCSANSMACYVLEKAVGKGSVLLLAGLPFFSNGLIGKSDNADASLRLRDWAGGISFDEYHHFFSDRSFWDLIVNPAFSVPLFGMALLLILFFLFAHTRFHERHRERSELMPAQSVHEWNEGIVSSSLTNFSRAEALDLHYEYIERIFRRTLPYSAEHQLIPTPMMTGRSESEMLREGSKLISLHRKLLLQRRRVEP